MEQFVASVPILTKRELTDASEVLKKPWIVANVNPRDVMLREWSVGGTELSQEARGWFFGSLEREDWFDRSWETLLEVPEIKPIDPADYKDIHGLETFIEDKASVLAADAATFEQSNGETPVFYFELEERAGGKLYPREGNNDKAYLDQCGISSQRCVMEKFVAAQVEERLTHHGGNEDVGFWLSPQGMGYKEGAISVYIREGFLVRCWGTLQPVDNVELENLAGALSEFTQSSGPVRTIEDLRVNLWAGKFKGWSEAGMWDYLKERSPHLNHVWSAISSGAAEERSYRARDDVWEWAKSNFEGFRAHDSWRSARSMGIQMEQHFGNLGWEMRVGGSDGCASLYSNQRDQFGLGNGRSEYATTVVSGRHRYRNGRLEKKMDACGACLRALFGNDEVEGWHKGMWLGIGDHCPHCGTPVPEGAVRCP